MAESPDKAEKSAEQAYAKAAAAPVRSEIARAEVAPVATDQPATREASAAAAPNAAKTIAKPVSKKPVAKVRRTFSRPKRVTATNAAAASTVTELKEKIMANAKTTTDFSKPFADAVSEFQSKAKAAYEKGTELAAEANEFAKGNVEAVVESGKLYAAGVQDLSKSYVEEAKSAYETFTADLKELAAVKSPAELFQLQGKLARRNFDAFVAYSSKNTDAVTKLASETFAPISGRMSLAAEKLSKAA